MKTLQQSERVLLFNQAGKPCAEVSDGILRKRVRASVHQLRRPPAWACDESILREAEALGAHTVQVTDVESGKVFTAPLDAFWRRGVKIERGHGRQIALPLQHWHRQQPQQMTLF